MKISLVAVLLAARKKSKILYDAVCVCGIKASTVPRFTLNVFVSVVPHSCFILRRFTNFSVHPGCTAGEKKWL